MGNTADRDAEDVELLKKIDAINTARRQGRTWAMIAQELGYTNASGPYKLYKNWFKKHEAELVEDAAEQRFLWAGRFEAIIRGGLYGRAQKGELQAIDRLMGIADRIDRWFGLSVPKASVHEFKGAAIEDGPEALARAVREVFGDVAARPLNDLDDDSGPLSDGGDDDQGGIGPPEAPSPDEGGNTSH